MYEDDLACTRYVSCVGCVLRLNGFEKGLFSIYTLLIAVASLPRTYAGNTLKSPQE